MDFLYILDENKNRRKMEIVSTFTIDDYPFKYIVYRELDGSRYYLAKSKENYSKLSKRITKSEYKLCKAIFEELMEAKNAESIPELIVEKKHKGITGGKVRNATTRLTAAILGLTMSISINSGLLTKAHAEELPTPTGIYQSEDNNSDENGLENNTESVCIGDQEISISELENVQYLFLNLNSNDTSLECLKCCEALELLSFYDKGISSLDIFKTLPTFNNKFNSFSISTIHPMELSNDILNHIMQSTNTKKLYLNNVILTPGSEELLRTLDTLKLSSEHISYDIDFNKLEGLKCLDLKEIKPYTIAMFLNREEYNHLIETGTDIVFEDENAKATYLKALDDLDQIVASLEIPENASDMDIINAVLAYVCDHLTYSESVRNKEEESERYYKNGLLDAVFNNQDQICGNYASLVEAIMDRIKSSNKSAYMISDNHAWNIMIIDGEPYYVDATWLDNEYIEIRKESFSEGVYSIDFDREYFPDAFKALQEGNERDLSKFHWNQMPIDSDEFREFEQNDDHSASYELSYMDAEGHQVPIVIERPNEAETPIETEEPIENDASTEKEEKKYEIKIGPKVYIVSGATLVSLLSGAGVLIAVKKKNEEIRRKARMQSGNQSSYWTARQYGQNPRNTSSKNAQNPKNTSLNRSSPYSRKMIRNNNRTKTFKNNYVQNTSGNGYGGRRHY